MSAEEARAEAERRYPFDAPDPYQPDHERLTRSVFVQGQRTGWIDHAEWQASREVTEAEVRRAAKAAWVALNGDNEWAKSVVDDVFSPADDLPEEAFDMVLAARAALVAAREVRS